MKTLKELEDDLWNYEIYAYKKIEKMKKRIEELESKQKGDTMKTVKILSQIECLKKDNQARSMHVWDLCGTSVNVYLNVFNNCYYLEPEFKRSIDPKFFKK